MALKGQNTEINSDLGEKIPAFLAEFTGGTLNQLNDLAIFLEREGFDIPKENSARNLFVIRIAIGWLENLREKAGRLEEEK